MIFYKTNSSNQTKKFAAELAEKFFKKRAFRVPKNALVFALQGDLGSGKTTFVQGFSRALGVRKNITSPTFVLMKNYPIFRSRTYRKLNKNIRKSDLQKLSYEDIYHIDCYRIKKSKELSDLGLKQILSNPQNIVLIEWPEKIRRILPKNAIWLKFEHGEKENIRYSFYQFRLFKRSLE